MILKKFQQGGQMDPAMEQAPVEQAPVEQAPVQGGEEQLAQIATQLVQMLLQEVGDPNAVAAILQMALDVLSQAAQGGAPQEQPVFKKGGKIVNKAKCGTKMKVKK